MIHYPYLTPEVVLTEEQRARLEEARALAERRAARRAVREALQVRV